MSQEQQVVAKTRRYCNDICRLREEAQRGDLTRSEEVDLITRINRLVEETGRGFKVDYVDDVGLVIRCKEPEKLPVLVHRQADRILVEDSDGRIIRRLKDPKPL